MSGEVEYYFSLIEIRAELNIFQACIFDFFLFDFNTKNDGTDLDLGTLISSKMDGPPSETTSFSINDPKVPFRFSFMGIYRSKIHTV